MSDNLWSQIHNNATIRVFVFGSNLAGRHGKGSALEAFRTDVCKSNRKRSFVGTL
jgi:hypothetical protein